uniref:Uncharacterized protein n=1 Tax=Panagrolaimus sp. ES5 TaxID=591445 RepID=A0AC34G326_9BILA
MFEKRKTNCLNDFDKRDNSNAINKSTLSLHIVAYENSIEASNGNECLKDKNDEKLNLIKKWKNTKQLLADSVSFVQNPFEFPRQQKENSKVKPEMMQFKASQKLLNPNSPEIKGKFRVINKMFKKINCAQI